MTVPPRGKSKTPVRSRPVTPSYLRNAALHYLAGRASSVSMLRQTLERRAKKRLAGQPLTDEARLAIEAVLAELVRLDLLDDKKFAETRGASLERKGFSGRRITQGLRAKGIAAETIEATGVAHVDELTQARLFAERKRLGPWRRAGAGVAGNGAETRDQDLRALARAGFGFAIATKALTPEP